MAVRTSMSDADLLRRMGGGDEEAFGVLYQRWQGAIYRFALRMSGAAPLAEEVVQDVFLLLIRGGAVYDARRGSVGGFLYGISRNLVLRFLEKERPYLPLEEPEEDQRGPEPVAGGDDALARMTNAERSAAVHTAVVALPPRYREVVVLCELEEMSYADAAVALDCSIGTVRSRLHRGRALLASKLRGHPVRTMV